MEAAFDAVGARAYPEVLTAPSERTSPVDFMIAAKLRKGLLSQTMSMRSQFHDERLESA